MNAADLCLIIDNTQSFLREWLELSRSYDGKLTATMALLNFRELMGGVCTDFQAAVRTQIECRIDWQEVADHYNLKVKEGASVPTLSPDQQVLSDAADDLNEMNRQDRERKTI